MKKLLTINIPNQFVLKPTRLGQFPIKINLFFSQAQQILHGQITQSIDPQLEF
jgi:hypothetical protein